MLILISLIKLKTPYLFELGNYLIVFQVEFNNYHDSQYKYEQPRNVNDFSKKILQLSNNK